MWKTNLRRWICNHCFRYLIPLWLVNCDSYFSFSVARAESNKHVEHMKPSYIAVLDVLTFDVLTRETNFFLTKWVVVGRLRYLKGCSQALPFSIFSRRFPLVRHFSARSLFSLVRTDREPDTGNPRTRFALTRQQCSDWWFSFYYNYYFLTLRSLLVLLSLRCCCYRFGSKQRRRQGKKIPEWNNFIYK